MSSQLDNINDIIIALFQPLHSDEDNASSLRTDIDNIKLLLEIIRSNGIEDPIDSVQIENFEITLQVIEGQLEEKVSRQAHATLMPTCSSSELYPLLLTLPAQHRPPNDGQLAGPSSSQCVVTPPKFFTLQHLIPNEVRHVKNNVFQIRCLDQNTQSNGGYRCGFHALKNALCALAVANGYDTGPHIEIFQNVDLYKYFESYALALRGAAADHDASEPHLRAVWEEVLAGNVSPFPGADASHWERNELSIFHVGSDTINGHLFPVLKGSDENSLESVINLKEVIERQGPFRHTFIVGAEEHWTTLVYEKNEEQNVRWYGLNSRRDIQEEFCKNIPILESAMKAFEETAHKEYYSSMGYDLEIRSSLLLNNNGCIELIDDLNVEVFFDQFTFEAKYLPKLLIAAQFMYRMGWLVADSIQHALSEKEIFHVRVLMEFYRNTHSDDPQFLEIEQLLINA